MFLAAFFIILWWKKKKKGNHSAAKMLVFNKNIGQSVGKDGQFEI